MDVDWLSLLSATVAAGVGIVGAVTGALALRNTERQAELQRQHEVRLTTLGQELELKTSSAAERTRVRAEVQLRLQETMLVAVAEISASFEAILRGLERASVDIGYGDHGDEELELANYHDAKIALRDALSNTRARAALLPTELETDYDECAAEFATVLAIAGTGFPLPETFVRLETRRGSWLAAVRRWKRNAFDSND